MCRPGHLTENTSPMNRIFTDCVVWCHNSQPCPVTLCLIEMVWYEVKLKTWSYYCSGLHAEGPSSERNPVQHWLGELAALYEPECMTTLQSKSLAVDLSHQVAMMAAAATNTVKILQEGTRLISTEFAKLCQWVYVRHYWVFKCTQLNVCIKRSILDSINLERFHCQNQFLSSSETFCLPHKVYITIQNTVLFVNLIRWQWNYFFEFWNQ